jgi:hypothetical protein
MIVQHPGDGGDGNPRSLGYDPDARHADLAVSIPLKLFLPLYGSVRVASILFLGDSIAGGEAPRLGYTISIIFKMFYVPVNDLFWRTAADFRGFGPLNRR